MITMLLSEIAKACDGRLVGTDCQISSVSTDSRHIDEQGLFVALIGERFDAHDFIPAVQEQGASALLVSKKVDTSLPQVIVSDTQKALGLMAKHVHQVCHTFTFSLTGSCGKTTVKEMLASILTRSGEVLATAGNFNNEIGVPLTLLRSQPSNDFAVIELGANHQNEISYTTQLAQPNVALVNNIAAAHLEGFGSIEGVAKAKGEIFEGLQENGTAIYNLDSNGLPKWSSLFEGKKVFSFAMSNSSADFYASNIEINGMGEPSFQINTPQGSTQVSLGIIGKHNVVNAVAAAALAIQANASLDDIQQGLQQLSSVKGRVAVETLGSGLKVIDDTYNASVPAMKAAVDLLSGFKGQRWLVLGNMAELGEESLALHREVGEYAAPYQFEQVVTFGDDTKVISELCNGRHFETRSDLNAYLLKELQSIKHNEVTVLVKGANSSRMSEVVSALKECQ
ncbi:UDP-N-acetylmuramoyl-tripeptide--D-alanyl-D-alanine ligase [Aliivibrio sp. S4TY2]|uniref:UDP-N-acetylmuramoyl-tripeptide--D-alanyl-D- alanine ligase n=1 Tax=unclassified Aliivibrio TaxID=2645654 RepID=UPI00237878F8|nr:MULTISPECIES: UDP-N-acetylmuramoyl-tripeptide--D-alanyl-D-alanine ligase [unclassified Aliivibrio]MDD9155895.1 UDP-N-acetylmuramoyl-tripeptide--D-alanyl-D-alanine ligase [Aliivibrio sp. S4TY2]MDD9159425.1 UDP-N-acetylmuramoyl-tripeptide--D-alanyl-D-alanine ligase [Aliivibrio sp. S4TY1]MDD9163603.1 UDP-N-acetylmuramoyl-tripeptide--D-alanyl-D-alanine ligase [Aliivibrio sp. S4MY2]MDD9167604.1 UDP-N-acetylmuramoyl-tripeptide--D-alanyl-D-alanine ligase [Aliivibrio sp. S4MY4]MDD9186128.1 UDP-N-ac